jgi:hypothetical protein
VILAEYFEIWIIESNLNDYDIECVSNYKYLGLHFTASGSFHFAQTELYKKALKAYYKLRKDFFQSKS